MSALVSVIPIVLLIVLMMGFKVSGYKSAIITLLVTIVLALVVVPSMGILPEKFTSAGTSIFGITLWSVIEGFLKLAVPTATAVAPAMINSIASSAESIPPIPMIGIFTVFAA